MELCLPDKREYIIYAPFSSTQIKINQAIADRKLEELCTAESSGGFQPAADGSWAGSECVGNVNEKATSLQNVVMQMRKCCNHPYLFQVQYFGMYILLLNRSVQFLHSDDYLLMNPFVSGSEGSMRQYDCG